MRCINVWNLKQDSFLILAAVNYSHTAAMVVWLGHRTPTAVDPGLYLAQF